jgi:perosamine synthetase
MKKNELAIFGGQKTVVNEFKKYNPIGIEELKAATSVIESGVLSKFIGTWSDDFYGGPKVQEFERQCEKYFNVKHAVTVNSWTSGLIAAVGAVGIEPGDEVIVSTWTMCATATAILHWNAIPVFADIDPNTFNIDPKSVEKNITPLTKAIIAVDIFGQSCDMKELNRIAKKNNLKIITDTAQAPGTFTNGREVTGTLADVGGFSLNYHKHIHTGEGGVLVTNNDEIFERLQLIRNHGEAVVEGKGVKNISNIIGYNFRLGEIECAIGIEQLKKLDKLVSRRQEIAKRLSEGLGNLRGLKTPFLEDGNTHAYYVYPLVLNIDLLGVSRKKIVDALNAEGLDFSEGFVNVHLLPMYQKKIAYGTMGFPWTSNIYKGNVSYEKGICPVAESLHEKSLISYGLCTHELSDVEVDMIINAFIKVWDNLHNL